MNRILARWLLVSVTFILILLFVLRNRSPFGSNNSSFASGPRKEITSIEFSQDGKSLILVKEGADWLINGNVKARKSSIVFILRVLQEIKIKSPVSPELFENEITAKGILPVRVKVYEKRKLLKSFLVYKTNSNSFGNIMKVTERSKPFIVYVPDYEGSIGNGFILNELFWQPYSVFNLLPSEIAHVKLENFSDSSSSFSLNIANRIIKVSDLKNDLEGWDTTLVTRYISYFGWIPFESWVFEHEEDNLKIIESKQPLYRLTVVTVSGKETQLTLWERQKTENHTQVIDSDRLIGRTSDMDELFIIRYFDIDPLLKKRAYFFQKL